MLESIISKDGSMRSVLCFLSMCVKMVKRCMTKVKFGGPRYLVRRGRFDEGRSNMTNVVVEHYTSDLRRCGACPVSAFRPAFPSKGFPHIASVIDCIFECHAHKFPLWSFSEFVPASINISQKLLCLTSMNDIISGSTFIH